ncbi:type VII secretion protein EccCa [Propionibacteriaceae bacterium Y1685]
MGVVTWVRSKRADPPPMPRGDLLLESPPEIPPPPASKGFGAVLRILPMVAGAGAMAMMMTSGGGGRGPLGMVMGGMYGVSMLGMMMSQVGRGNDDTAAQLDASRRDYFRYLNQTRRKVRQSAAAQRRAVTWRHPHPAVLWSTAGQKRMWERRPESDDFMSIRISEGPQQFAQRITPPESKPIEDLEPLTTGALRRFIRTHRTVPSVPLALSFKGFSTVQLIGDLESERKLAYSMVAQVATWHAPTDCRIVFCVAPEVRHLWDWAKWLPHTQHPTRRDGAGSIRLFATNTTDLAQVSDGAVGHGDAAPKHVVLVVDGISNVSADSLSSPSTRVTMIDVSTIRERPRRVETGHAVLEVREETLMLHRRQPSGQIARTPLGRPDQIPMVTAEILARALAPYRMPTTAVEEVEDDSAEVTFEPPKDYPAMLGQGDPLTFDLRQNWKLRPMHQRLRIPVGNGTDMRPVELDIKESALGGMGPHGICIGATGSGKSEFLRTLVLGLAMTHSSEFLNFVLVDFKGGATFLGLDTLPHVSAVITNLEGELTLVDRMQDALAGEMERRMEVLRDAGNFKNREDYEEARLEGLDVPPMPSLFIVVDEFSELLSARPEFIELFIQIGRIGRSVGVHQLLASQRLEEGKLRGLDTFLSYRIALRTFSAAESRTVIGVPDAYELPSGPGNGYLKYDTTNMVQFKAAYVSGPWEGSSASPVAGSSAGGLMAASAVQPKAWIPPVLEFESSHVPIVEPPSEPGPDESDDEVESETKPAKAEEEDEAETLLNIVVGKLRGQGWPAHQVWLPPLDDPPTADQLLGELTTVEGRGLTTADPRFHHTLNAPVALVDRPRQQRRDPMWMNFSGSGGHLAVVGGPQSGKSTALRTVMTTLALTHTPQEIGFYVLDFGGGSLGAMRDMPHVGSVCGRLDVDRVRRTVAEMTSLVQSRELAFAEQGIDSMNTYRRGRRDGSIPADRFPTDVFLIIDGWQTLRSEFEEQDPVITTLAGRGLGFGVHIVGTGNKWSDFRLAIRDLIQSRIELKLGDAFESEIDRKVAALVPGGRPGRGLSTDKLHMLTALPRIDSVESADDLADGARNMITAMNEAWQGPRAAEVRMLPEMLPASSLPPVEYNGTDRSFPFGVDELELSPTLWDPSVEPHFVAFGAPESGKSSLLRTFLDGITTRYATNEAKVMIIDYRRSLLGYVESDHMLGYAASHDAANELIKQAAGAIKARLPGPDVTQQQLRDRSWWKGPDLFVVVDDYELVATSLGNPLQQMAPYVSQALDVGLHVVIARGMGGAGRSAFSDQVIARMKDAVNPGLIMSGTKDEGALLADVKPTPLPPGRGTLVTRAGKVLVQTAFQPPKDEG